MKDFDRVLRNCKGFRVFIKSLSHSQRRLYVLWVFLSSVFLMGCVGPPPDNAKAVAKDIRLLLSSLGYCKSKDCVSDEIVMTAGALGDEYINIYKAGNFDKEVISAINNAGVNRYYEKDRELFLTIKVFRASREKRWDWFSSEQPFLELVVKGMD